MSTVRNTGARALPAGLVYPAQQDRESKRQAQRDLSRAIATAVWHSTLDSDRSAASAASAWPEGSTWVDIPIAQYMTPLADPDALAGAPSDYPQCYDAKGGA